MGTGVGVPPTRVVLGSSDFTENEQALSDSVSASNVDATRTTRFTPVWYHAGAISPRALLLSMSEAELITTDPRDIVIQSVYDEVDAACYLDGSTTYENSLFLEMLSEVLGPVGDPRYLLCVRDVFFRKQRGDFYSVPKELGKKRDAAERFAELWEKRICPVRLTVFFGRHTHGRDTVSHAYLSARK